MTEQGIVLFAHGARDARWAEPFARLQRLVAARLPDAQVTLAFLEHMTPDLAAAAQALAAKGVTRVRVVPLFFGRGGHLREDFPGHVARAQAAVPGLVIDVTEAAGESDAVLAALADFALAGLE